MRVTVMDGWRQEDLGAKEKAPSKGGLSDLVDQRNRAMMFCGAWFAIDRDWVASCC